MFLFRDWPTNSKKNTTWYLQDVIGVGTKHHPAAVLRSGSVMERLCHTPSLYVLPVGKAQLPQKHGWHWHVMVSTWVLYGCWMILDDVHMQFPRHLQNNSSFTDAFLIGCRSDNTVPNAIPLWSPETQKICWRSEANRLTIDEIWGIHRGSNVWFGLIFSEILRFAENDPRHLRPCSKMCLGLPLSQLCSTRRHDGCYNSWILLHWPVIKDAFCSEAWKPDLLSGEELGKILVAGYRERQRFNRWRCDEGYVKITDRQLFTVCRTQILVLLVPSFFFSVISISVVSWFPRVTDFFPSSAPRPALPSWIALCGRTACESRFGWLWDGCGIGSRWIHRWCS